MSDPAPKRHQLLSPKQDYLRPQGVRVGEATEAGRFADIAVTPEFRRAVEVALLEFVVRQKPTDSVGATMAGLELEGAKRLANILLNLGVDDPPTQSSQSTIKPLART